MIDKKDRKILAALRDDARRSSQTIAALTGIPASTVHHRIRQLARNGVIKRYTIDLDQRAMGKEIAAYVLVSVDYKLLREKGATQHQLAAQLRKHEYVEEVAMITGASDIILRVRVGTIAQLDEFVTRYLRNIDGVEKTQTSVVLSLF